MILPCIGCQRAERRVDELTSVLRTLPLSPAIPEQLGNVLEFVSILAREEVRHVLVHTGGARHG